LLRFAYLFGADSALEAPVANREQRSNKEKKKPKTDKNQKTKAAPPPFQAPELIRKPHKGKQDF